MSSEVLSVDVFADVACPWCWIGERRLARAIERVCGERPELVVERRWRPFQLQPQLPRAGQPWAAFAREKFGGAAGMTGAFAHVAAAGAPDGLEYHFDRITVAPNTADAHRLILHARGAGLEWAMAEALFHAYFAAGRDVSDAATLADIAAEVGVPRDEASALLAGDALAAEVHASQRDAARLGIRGVPFVVLDGRLGVSGAQPIELFERALAAALEPEPV